MLQHRGSETSFELPLALDAGGIGESEWTPPKGAPMGDYDIRVKPAPSRARPATEDEARRTATIYTDQSFRVDEYRLPTMRATVAGPRTPSVSPTQLPLDLFVGYLSGGGSAGRRGQAAHRLGAARATRPDGWEGWSFGGSAVREGTVAARRGRQRPGGAEMPAASTIPLTLDSERRAAHPARHAGARTTMRG